MKLWRLAVVVCFLVTACGGGDTPAPTPVIETPNYDACLPEVGESTLEVVTWNVENFPVHTNTAMVTSPKPKEDVSKSIPILIFKSIELER
tara:strand:- start:13173 stop:13445 length:273 start_codon:yes stop_codon:yes gene_type:complete